MKDFLKNNMSLLPRSLRVFLVKIYEDFYSSKTKRYYSYKNTRGFVGKEGVGNILFYHPNGLSFGGTEKFLQILAKHLNKDKYNIFFMYSSGKGTIKNDGRKKYLENSGVIFIPFEYSHTQSSYPYIIEKMNPSIFDIVNQNKIDLIVTAGSGYSQFPINIIKDIPIIMLNIFGSPSSQKNIIKHVCISQEVANKISPVVSENKIEIMYIPSEVPTDQSKKVLEIKNRFGLSDGDFIFGRIGRGDNSIFDPIGIRAFKRILKDYPNAHYLIMSAPPILKRIVGDEKIKNVHFLEASADESDIWAFHQTIDCLAHFRNDGESCGLNIIESLLCGNPIITHKSHIWNAHLEYLNPKFSRIAEKGDNKKYAEYMIEMIEMKNSGELNKIKYLIQKEANEKFLIENNIGKFERLIH